MDNERLFTEQEIETLRWLIRSERQVQYMIVPEEGLIPESTIIEELEVLYDKVSSLIPNKSLGSL